MLTIGFVGAGITGTALAVRLAQQDYRVIAVASRTLASAERLAQRIKGCRVYQTVQEVADKAQLVFITTPDDVISEVAARVCWHKGQSVVHCSGAHSMDIIESARQFGANAGCFHPLQTFASIEQAMENLTAGNYWPSSDINSKDVVIRDIKLAYYEPVTLTQYVQPVYVFKGDNNFIAFVPAVLDKYIAK